MPATLSEAFLQTVEVRGDAPALLGEDLTVAFTWRTYGEHARQAAAGLAELGLAPGDTLGLLLSNRVEFHVADAAALLLGATPFSMYNTSAPEQLAYLIADAGCRIVVTEHAYLAALTAARAHGAVIDHVVVVGDGGGGAETRWEELFVAGSLADDDVHRSQREDIATVIYTSGTTGAPKGVQLTHGNLLTMAGDVTGLLGVVAEDRAISYLPMAHVAERVCTHYLPMVVGFAVVCCSRPAGVVELLPRVRPGFFFSPPRLWEKLRASLLTSGQLDDGPPPPEVAAALRRQLGFDALGAAITGAAPCPPAVIEFFHSIGVPLREIYGLSETTGLATMTSAQDIRVGTVGPPLPSIELRLADDGEVLIRGPLVMAGYRNRPEATAEAIDSGGWLHTGDIGRLDGAGHLQIVDRKKELIINAAGKNMSPANIEARLKESTPLIGQACAIGDGRPYNVALIVLDPDTVRAQDPKVDLRAAVQAGVDVANARLARVEQIKRFVILDADWQPDSEELTATMKLKRRPIAEKYAEQIDALYTTNAQQESR